MLSLLVRSLAVSPCAALSAVFGALFSMAGAAATATTAEAAALQEARLARVEGLPDAIAVVVRHEGDLAPERLRVFFDTDGRGAGEPNTGADLLIEGPSFHTYPEGGSGWQWTRIGTPSFTRRDGELVCIVRAEAFARPFKWFLETTTPEWAVGERWPARGVASADPASLPTLAAPEPVKPIDLGPLLGAMTPTLSTLLAGGPDFSGWRDGGAVGDFAAASERLDTLRWPSAGRLRAVLRDAASGEVGELVPRRLWRRDGAVAWTGETLGVEWALVADAGRESEFRLTGWMRAKDARVVRVEVGLGLPLEGMTWADDISTARVIEAGGAYGHFASGRYGLHARQSFNPIAVVEDARRAWVLETDPGEPRVFDLSADAAFFRAGYELALTPETKKFPGQATFRCAFYSVEKNGDNGFRTALAEFFRRWPDFAERRVPHSGLWMPFSDISKLPRPEDFGFSFFEKTGELGADVDYAHRNGVLTLVYAEPWLYWLPFNPGEERTPTRALEKMRELAALGTGWSRDLAASGLAGAARDARGDIRVKFMDLPWNQGARMEVSSDPDLAGVEPFGTNRAMAEWRRIAAWLEDPRVDGIYLDSMDAAVMPDHAAGALAATDHPATYTRAGLEAVVAPNIPQYEFTAALGALLRGRGKYLMANFPLTDSPFLNRWIDIPGEETDWWSGGQYNPPARAKLDYRRAFSGRKPFGFLQSTDFRSFTGEPLRRYFETCLLYGFQPSFFSHNAADDPYWHDAKLLERDRPLFLTYVPLTRRIADAGWRPVRAARLAEEAGARLEQFGEPRAGLWHLALQNQDAERREVTVTLARETGTHGWIEPLSGRAGMVEGGGRLSFSLDPHEVVLVDLVAPARWEAERAFLAGWRSGAGEADAARASWESLTRERAAGLRVSLAPAGRIIAGGASAWTLDVRNDGADTVSLAAAGEAPVAIRAGESGGVRFSLPAGDGAFRVIDWEVKDANGMAARFARALRVRAVPPLEVSGPGARFLARQAQAKLPLRLKNHTEAELEGVIEWAGERRVVRLPAGGEQTLALEVEKPKDADAKEVALKASVAGWEWWAEQCRVVFLDAQASLAGAAGVELATDSTFGGYGSKALTDGVTKTEHLAWNEAAWASADSPEDHWIRVAFPAPVAVQEVVIHWHEEGGVTYAGRAGLLLGEVATGQELVLANWETTPGARFTRITIPRQMLKTLRVVQGAGQGAAARPGIMWVAELQVN